MPKFPYDPCAPSPQRGAAPTLSTPVARPPAVKGEGLVPPHPKIQTRILLVRTNDGVPADVVVGNNEYIEVVVVKNTSGSVILSTARQTSNGFEIPSGVPIKFVLSPNVDLYLTSTTAEETSVILSPVI